MYLEDNFGKKAKNVEKITKMPMKNKISRLFFNNIKRKTNKRINMAMPTMRLILYGDKFIDLKKIK